MSHRKRKPIAVLADLAYLESENLRQDRAAELAHMERVKKARLKHPDFDAVIDACETVLPPAFAFVLREHPNSAELAYQLSKRPKELERLLQVKAVEQVTTYPLREALEKFANEWHYLDVESSGGSAA